MHTIWSIDSIWQEVKTYFGDGYIARSSPFRFNVHFCHLKPQPNRNDNIYYGVEISEDMMPLFSSLGPTSAPPCSCKGMVEVVEHFEDFIRKYPGHHSNDYSLHTGKGDTSIEETYLYGVRDTIQWWANWHPTTENHYWSILFTAFAGILDDVMIPPQDIVNGKFRVLGHTLSDVLNGLRSENVDPDDVKFMEMCLWRQSIVQYLEKADPELRAKLTSNSSLMTQFRTLTGGTHGVAVAILAARGARSLGVTDEAVELASMCQLMCLDMAKEALGILKGEKTETVTGDRYQLKCEMRWIYTRCLECFDSQPNAHILRRYATSGLHYVPLMDRYRERLKQKRFPLSPAMRRKSDSYRATEN